MRTLCELKFFHLANIFMTCLYYHLTVTQLLLKKGRKWLLSNRHFFNIINLTYNMCGQKYPTTLVSLSTLPISLIKKSKTSCDVIDVIYLFEYYWEFSLDANFSAVCSSLCGADDVASFSLDFTGFSGDRFLFRNLLIFTALASNVWSTRLAFFSALTNFAQQNG